MNHEQAEVGESLNARPKSSGDAPANIRVRPPTSPFSTPEQDDIDVRRAIVSWTIEQLDRAQPWEQFADTTKFSIPKSAQEVTNRMQWNVERFRSNYGVLFVVILAGFVMSSMALVVSVTAVAAVCAAFKLHQDEEVAAVWGTGLMLSMNHRLVVAALVALPLLQAADIWYAIMWSIASIVAIGAVHATLYAGSPNKPFAEKLPGTPAEGDVSGHL